MNFRGSASTFVSGAVFLAAFLVASGLKNASTTATVIPSGSQPLVYKQDLAYVGAFRLPAATSSTKTFGYGGTALTYVPGRDSLLVVGHDWYQEVAEISIPTPGTGATVAALPRAALRQPLTDILAGRRLTIDGDTQNGVKIGGILPVGNSLVVTAWSYYDAGPVKQTRTHFVTSQDFSSLGNVIGPLQVGRGFQHIVPSDTSRIGGFVSGYMAPIPPAWRSALGGTALTGQGGRVSILVRTSSGPSATVFTPSDLGNTTPAPGKIVMGYPSDSSDPGSTLDHPTLGSWGINGGLYNGTQGFRGMIFPDGTDSVLFFGWGADDFCYGSGTDNAALHLQPVPGSPGTHYCYDPTPGGVGNKGTHSYPTKSIVWAYNANDFVAVKNGSKKPWDVKPYATWDFTLPFQSNVVNGIETGTFEIVGAAYDPATKRIFLSSFRGDGTAPVIHVLTLNAGSAPANQLCYW